MIHDWMQRFAVIDVETTGLSSSWDRILEVGLVVYGLAPGAQTPQPIVRRDFFVNPEGKVIPEALTKLHGISVEQTHDAPYFYEVYNQIGLELYNVPIVAYGGAFDRRFLLQHIMRSWPRSAFEHLPYCFQLDARWIDVCALARHYVTDLPGNKWKLVKVAEHLGYNMNDAHRADYDAMVTGAILLQFEGRHRADDWSFNAVIERARKADFAYQIKRFFWDRDKSQGYLPKEERVQVFECDVCHMLKAGQYLGPGCWTKPEHWIYAGPSHVERVVCSDTCEMALAWYASGRLQQPAG